MDVIDISNKPNNWFPHTHLAQENGLLCFGGALSPNRLISAYTRGIFPCPLPHIPMLWWTTHPRLVLAPKRIHIGRTVQKELRRHPWRATTDACFKQVIQACKDNRANGSWITPEIANAYTTMHLQGYAHSIEIWLQDSLVGGLYGMALGRIFFGESVFSTQPNAGKIALVACAALLDSLGYALIDCQMQSPLLQSMGARCVSRKAFERILHKHVTSKPGLWCSDNLSFEPTLI